MLAGFGPDGNVRTLARFSGITLTLQPRAQQPFAPLLCAWATAIQCNFSPGSAAAASFPHGRRWTRPKRVRVGRLLRARCVMSTERLLCCCVRERCAAGAAFGWDPIFQPIDGQEADQAARVSAVAAMSDLVS
jgi:hypothetical protein